MKPKTLPQQKQGNFLYHDLLEQLNPKAPLLLLAKKIPWEMFEEAFVPLYADLGRPAKPIRLMVGLLLLKQLENLSDDRVVDTDTKLRVKVMRRCWKLAMRSTCSWPLPPSIAGNG